MEIKGTDRIAIMKPVASRPSSSIIWPLSGLLTRGIRPLAMGPETGNGPIKPETIRFKPTINRAPPLIVSSQGDDPKSDIKPNVLYRPLANLVSKTAVSVLTNTAGNFEPCDRPAKPPPSARVESIGHRIKKPHSYRTQLKSNFREDLSDPTAAAGGDCSSSPSVKDSRHVPPAASGDQLSCVGYNWRKYGQKQVKGSEYPRSYYKCTHTDCPVKKKVEQSMDGQIAEIVYRGEHNHSKPQPPKRGPGTGQDMSDHLMSTRVTERNEGCECMAEASNNISLKGSLAYDCVVDREPTTAGLNRDDSCGLSAQHEDGNMRIGIDPDETRSKRRKTINQQNGVEINGEGLEEPAVSAQGSVVDPEILGDGFRWRKYGQKVVKGNLYPRSYYKCTSLECNVRKIVERALDDPTVFITTYEGKHNHEMPLRSMRMSMPSSEPTLRATTSKEKLPF